MKRKGLMFDPAETLPSRWAGHWRLLVTCPRGTTVTTSQRHSEHMLLPGLPVHPPHNTKQTPRGHRAQAPSGRRGLSPLDSLPRASTARLPRAPPQASARLLPRQLFQALSPGPPSTLLQAAPRPPTLALCPAQFSFTADRAEALHFTFPYLWPCSTAAQTP